MATKETFEVIGDGKQLLSIYITLHVTGINHNWSATRDYRSSIRCNVSMRRPIHCDNQVYKKSYPDQITFHSFDFKCSLSTVWIWISLLRNTRCGLVDFRPYEINFPSEFIIPRILVIIMIEWDCPDLSTSSVSLFETAMSLDSSEPKPSDVGVVVEKEGLHLSSLLTLLN